MDYAYQQYEIFKLVQESLRKEQEMDDFMETVVCMKRDCKNKRRCRLYDPWIGDFMPEIVKRSTGMGWKWTCKSFEKEEK